MKKQNSFKWAWGDHEPQKDPSITRERATKLLRAWRNSKTQGLRNFDLRLVRAHGLKFYLVKTTKYINDDAGVLVIAY